MTTQSETAWLSIPAVVAIGRMRAADSDKAGPEEVRGGAAAVAGPRRSRPEGRATMPRADRSLMLTLRVPDQPDFTRSSG